MTSASGQEMVDIVDDDDRVIATVSRREMRAGRLQHRVVFLAVVSSDGRLLVHRRSPDKDVWPGWWDMAVGGVVAAGETYDEAAVRELAEEVGITGVVPEPLGGGRYSDDTVAVVGRCYVVTYDGPLRFDDGEVVEARWVTTDELAALQAQFPFLPDSLELLMPQLKGLR